MSLLSCHLPVTACCKGSCLCRQGGSYPGDCKCAAVCCVSLSYNTFSEDVQSIYADLKCYRQAIVLL